MISSAQTRGISRGDLGLEKSIPVTILTGFLGSGKTTLLTQLLKHEKFTNTAVIINELGDIGLDNLLVQTPVDETVLLESGCLCCTLRGDLSATLVQLLARRVTGDIPAFERVVIETTGTADPVPLLQTLIEDGDIRPFFHPAGLVTMLDARNGSQQLDAHFQSVKQVAVADRVLITKSDLVSRKAVQHLKNRVGWLNPGVPVDIVLHGVADPAQIFSLDSGSRPYAGSDVDTWISDAAREAVSVARSMTSTCVEHPGQDDRPHHHHDDAIQTFVFRNDQVVHPAGLKLWLDLLSVFQGPQLLRVKGLVNVENRPVVVNAVQHVCHPPEALDEWPGPDRDSRIVFITVGLERQALESTLTAMHFRPTEKPDAAGIDTAGYRRFTAILEGIRRAT